MVVSFTAGGSCDFDTLDKAFCARFSHSWLTFCAAAAFVVSKASFLASARFDTPNCCFASHGNKGRKPKHALTFPVVKNVVKFIQRYAEVFGLPHPAPLRGCDVMPPVFLPASQTNKEVHRLYLQACEEMAIRAVCLSSFRDIWHQCIPHIRFITARTDVCHRCEELRRAISDAVEDKEKLATYD